MTGTLYKVLGPAGEAIHGGTGAWSLPRGTRPGAWMPPITPVLCASGYHVTRADSLASYLYGHPDLVVWEVEVRGEHVAGDGKEAWEQARLIRPTVLSGERVLRLVASDFAAHVHGEWDRAYPDDQRPADAIRAVRAWADGRITTDDRMQAARAASAAQAASAARAEAAAAQAARAARAASTASVDLAASVAWSAWSAWSAFDAPAARAAERAWQARHVADIIAGRRQPGRTRIARAKRAL